MNEIFLSYYVNFREMYQLGGLFASNSPGKQPGRLAGLNPALSKEYDVDVAISRTLT